MKIQIKYYDRQDAPQYKFMRSAYLVKFVDPNKFYPTAYSLNNDGSINHTPQMIKGEDLTERQILELFVDELL